MIKQLLHKVFTLSLALLVLVSTMSFAVEKHFCCDKLIDVSFFMDAEKCMTEASTTEDVISEDKCCTNIVDVIVGQNDEVVSSNKIVHFTQTFFQTNFIYSLDSLSVECSKKDVVLKNYSSPTLVVDLQVLDQVFLI